MKDIMGFLSWHWTKFSGIQKVAAKFSVCLVFSFIASLFSDAVSMILFAISIMILISGFFIHEILPGIKGSFHRYKQERYSLFEKIKNSDNE